jgi:hypothetical protein
MHFVRRNGLTEQRSSCALHKTLPIVSFLVGSLNPVHVHPEDGSCNVCQNVENLQHVMWLIPKSQSYTDNHVGCSLEFHQARKVQVQN